MAMVLLVDHERRPCGHPDQRRDVIAMSYRARDPTLAQLAVLPGDDFTVYSYDRRGDGECGDTKPFAKEREIEEREIEEREIEDIQTLVADAGGQAMLFGISSAGPSR
jgi:hypothetical protein